MLNKIHWQVLLFVFILVNLADAGLTFCGIKIGVFEEVNYLSNLLIDKLGLFWGLTSVKLLAICAGYWLYTLQGQARAREVYLAYICLVASTLTILLIDGWQIYLLANI